MLVDSISAVLPELQAQAESMMVTPCRISRAGSVTADPTTGADVIVAGALVYAGGCKIQTPENQVRDVESGLGTVAIQGLAVHVPVSSGPYRVGDVVEILAGAEVVRRFRVDGTHSKTWQTAQRLPVTEVP